MSEAFEIVKSVVEKPAKDDCALYTDLLASKLRRFDERTRIILMNEIDNLVFRTEINLTSSINILNSAVHSENNLINISTNPLSNNSLRNILSSEDSMLYFNDYSNQKKSTHGISTSQVSSEPIVNVRSEPHIYSNYLQQNIESPKQSTYSHSTSTSQVSSKPLENVRSEAQIYSNYLQQNIESPKQSTYSHRTSTSQVSSEPILNVRSKPHIYSNYLQQNIESPKQSTYSPSTSDSQVSLESILDVTSESLTYSDYTQHNTT
ncbi:unnamed protein product [Macrosiphum euphorbiae]|uniref:Uncharacterized protein n=1 Tax=Macrosiphum euphorbiae TaxID=13131 RepID=A0AAV0Y795_9HEMI|nr:unnamed protein product [Macrosiphum euphorbiae]